MVKPAWGMKRTCQSCGARFYDLNKKPIICPSCDTEFTGEIKVKSRRGRLPSEIAGSQVEEETAAAENEDEDNIEEIESDEETVSLDEIEEGDDEEARAAQRFRKALDPGHETVHLP